MRPLVVNVAELLRRPGSQKDLCTTVVAHELRVVDSEVPEGAPIDVDLLLESLADGIVVSGSVTAPWTGSCRRCLEPVGGVAAVTVQELFQDPPLAEEAFGFRGEQLDLEPMVREAVLLELPLAPLCRPDCAGLCPACGADRNVVDCGHEGGAADPRWAALDDLLQSGRLDPPAE